MIANGVFALVGYIIHFWLGRHLGPVEYGVFGVVLYLMNTVDLFITSGIPKSASKYIAEDFSKAWSIIKDANRIQLVFCALLFGLYFGLAGVIANLLNDPSLTPYIRLSTLAIPIYAFYSIYNSGYLNGMRKFGRQAMSITGVSLGKILATFLLVLVGFGVYGAIVGYSVGAVIGFLLAWRLLGPVKKNESGFGWRKLVGFSIPVTAFAVAFYLIMGTDLFVVKALVGSEVEVGYYTAATTISRIPYLLCGGLALSLFPSISRSTSSNNIELTNSYIRQSMRYMLMLVVPWVFLISATSTDLLTLVYSSRYLEASGSLSILVFGLGLLSILYILSQIIIGSGKPWVVLKIALPLVVVNFGLNVFLIPKYGLVGAASATTITGFLGMCAASLYVLWRFRTLVTPVSLGRICLASVLIYVIALQFSLPPLWLPLIYIGLFALYAGILWLTREFNREDLKNLKKIVPLSRFIGGSKIP